MLLCFFVACLAVFFLGHRQHSLVDVMDEREDLQGDLLRLFVFEDVEDPRAVHFANLVHKSLHHVNDDTLDVVGIGLLTLKLFEGVVGFFEDVAHEVHHASQNQAVEVLVLTLVVHDEQEEGPKLGLLSHVEQAVERVLLFALVVENCPRDHTQSIDDSWVVPQLNPTENLVSQRFDLRMLLDEPFDPKDHVARVGLQVGEDALEDLP